MSIGLWILFYVLTLAFWLWVVRWGGADVLEGSIFADLTEWLSSHLDVETIRGIGWIAIIAATIWFVVGVFIPAARFAW